ncbi:MAG: 30S ribosomal protein S12 methylthiotransferase RimO [Bacteroidales bacterium]|nr:30S ribosomal protein S12 methylthiotransferase RimO [Bacteroidales bacterium]
MKINIITLGCSKNTVDSENVAGHLIKEGHTIYFDRQQNDCDTVIVNTCGFIGDAKEESVNTLLEQIQAKKHFNQRHAHDARRRTLIAVGCLVERYRDQLRVEMPEVDGWYGVHEWNKLSADATNFTSLRQTSTPPHYAFLKIAEGCNRSCSYCAIPLIRGRHVSRPIDDLVAEAKDLVSKGVKELIIISQDTTYYGLDLYGKRCLGSLLERLATESGASWIRLHYTYPTSFPTDAIDVIRRHDNICNYIDIPLQHINSRILTSMKRGIDRKGTLRLLDTFRTQLPNVCIRTTLIVGYPGETAQEFEELKQFVRDAQFDRMGCFAYSPEEGTPAEALGDPVSEEEKELRVSELMAIQEQISLAKNQARIGHIYRVLVDRLEGDNYIARTEYDSPDIDDEVLIPTNTPLKIGEFYHVRITQAFENDLIAQLLK